MNVYRTAFVAALAVAALYGSAPAQAHNNDGAAFVGGLVAGAVLGGAAGAVINNRQYYRDTRGYCYYVDQYGQPHYDYNVRC